MDSMEFAKVIPRLRVFETRLLDKAKLDRMIDSSSAEDVIKILKETEYSNIMTNVKKAEDYENMLSLELERVYKELYDMCANKKIVDIMSIKYEYHNIKVLLKGKFLNKDFSDILIPIGRMDIVKFKNIIIENDYSDLTKTMRLGIEETITRFNLTKDSQLIDMILDMYMFEELREIAQELNDKFVTKYIKAQIDLTNIRTLLRVKNQNKERDFLQRALIKGGIIDIDTLISLFNDAASNIPVKLSHTDYYEMLKNNTTYEGGVLEKSMDNYIMKLMKDAKMIPFGMEPIIAYIYAKETEIKVIRIIMVGKLNNINAEIIRGRLRDVYV